MIIVSALCRLLSVDFSNQLLLHSTSSTAKNLMLALNYNFCEPLLLELCSPVVGSPPAPQPSNSQVQAPIGQTVRLQCPLPAGAERIEWSRDGGLRLPVSSSQSNRGQILE